MPDKLLDFWTALAYFIIGVSGASGGCLVAAHIAMRGRNVTGMLVLAYAFVGAVFAIAGMAALLLVTGFQIEFGRLVLIGLVLGVSGSTALAGANLTARFRLRRLGMDVNISVQRIGEPKNGEDHF